MKLMAIADEASKGIGFFEPSQKLPFSDFLCFQHYLHINKKKLALPHYPHSICLLVPASEVCVQPKTRTAQLGSTLRSLSHHLALLPSVGEVKTSFELSLTEESATTDPSVKPLNILVVPFPYRIRGSCFQGTDSSVTTSAQNEATPDARYFMLEQKWLTNGRRKLTHDELGGFLVDLIRSAEREVGVVHALVLPEGALDGRLDRKIADYLAARTHLEIFISGTLSRAPRNRSFDENQVYSAIFFKHAVYRQWRQTKHHRWRLDRGQVNRYHLGHVLDPGLTWWEKINISNRQCFFHVFRQGACLATLVCEDLARIDPVQTVLRSVGPNLVVALLMDGPQWERRWPGRYATVLADDPGSAVLTVTSLGMVRRSVMPGEKAPKEIALWKDASGYAQELKLPKGAHGLLLTVSGTWVTNFTMDGRSDKKSTLSLSLSGVRDVSHPDSPAWLDY